LSSPQRISKPALSGGKPISPFGLIGKYCTDLQKGLEPKYGEMRAQIQDSGFSRFLWDFVIDPSLARSQDVAQTGLSSGEQEPSVTDELLPRTSH
jgi:hypothetical protein